MFAKIRLHRNLIFLNVVGMGIFFGHFPMINCQTPSLHPFPVFRIGVVFAGFPYTVSLTMFDAFGFMLQRLEGGLGGFNF